MVEAILYELDINIKQEQILGTVFNNYLLTDKEKIVQNTNQFISSTIDSLVSNELKGTFVQEIYSLTKIIQNYFQSIEQRLFPFGLKDYLIYIDWSSSRLIFVSPKHAKQFSEFTSHESFVRLTPCT